MIDPEDLMEMIGGSKRGRERNYCDPENAAKQASKLPRLYRELFAEEDFQLGDLVEWKPGMASHKIPHYGQPCVVVELKPGQMNPDGSSGSPYFGSRADIRLGIIDPNDGEFIMWWFDKRHFRHYQPPSAQQ